MSSAILYLAIVAIWAVVLVPRWLRPRPAPPQPVPVPAEPAAANWSEPAGLRQDADPARAGPPDVAGEPVASVDVAEEPVADVPAGDAEEETVPEPDSVTAPATRRAEVVKARRRLLITLISLTVIAAALAVVRVDAYWIVVPPALLLAGYLVLLRKFAQIDAERNRHAARRHADAGPGAGQEPTVSGEPALAAPPAAAGPGADEPAGAPPHGAEIIDISSRIGDQVYDQYSDAANRAVGD